MSRKSPRLAGLDDASLARNGSCRVTLPESDGTEVPLKTFLTCFLLLFVGASAMAQSDPAPVEIGGVTFSGNIRERYEAWDWFQPTTGQNLYSYSGTLMRFSFSQKKQNYDWNIELAVPVLLGIPNKAVDPAPQGQLGLGGNYYAANDNSQYAAFIFPKQAFLRFKGDHSSLRLGRFEFVDGAEVKPKDATLASLKNDRIAQRLLGSFGFSDVMRSFDGVNYVYSNGPWNLTAVSAIPTRGVFQVDGWGWVKTPITYVALTRQVDFGTSHAEWRIFGLFYNDDRGVLKTDNRPAAVRSKDLGGIDIGTHSRRICFLEASAHMAAISLWRLLPMSVRLMCWAGALCRTEGGERSHNALAQAQSKPGTSLTLPSDYVPGFVVATTTPAATPTRLTERTALSSPCCPLRGCMPVFRFSTP